MSQDEIDKQMARMPWTSGVVYGMVVVGFLVVSGIVSVLFGVPFIGLAVSVYGIGVLIMIVLRSYQFLKKQVAAEVAAERSRNLGPQKEGPNEV
jgi:hypothetical protein